MKLNKILFYVGLVLVTVGCLLLIAASFVKDQKLSDLFLTISSIVGVLSIGILIVRLVLMVRNPVQMPDKNTRVVVKVVDVKDIPKSKEQQLYEQYEDLYKKNLISKEDLDKKRQELLGK